MQLVCISNRPRQLRETLVYWDHLAPFISNALVVCPGQLLPHMVHDGRIELTVVMEEELLGQHGTVFAQSDNHQARNLLLRAAIARSHLVDDCFVMADDDCRPLVLVERSLFGDHGRHRGFYFHRLEDWPASSSDYDRGQLRSAQLLAERGLPTLSYSAHMPQIIHKPSFAEVFDELAAELEQGEPLDEWSLYFNTAPARHPQRFCDPAPYRTLCWPGLPTDWQPQVRAPEYLFENFYPTLYAPGRLFTGIPTAFDEARHQEWAGERIRRREAAQKAYDSFRGRLTRRVGWVLYRWVGAGQRSLRRHPALHRVSLPLLPRALREQLRAIADKGHDPAFWRRYG